MSSFIKAINYGMKNTMLILATPLNMTPARDDKNIAMHFAIYQQCIVACKDALVDHSRELYDSFVLLLFFLQTR